ncbi:hypothetical protein [Corynebacterium epidermidicanis]|uniref:Uncharacterized protein n=1 Tax=Corynebacterium epidermidicanis TaxID=1050174 RepID=A0A0G3GWV9_9CORY|nr:hypothetical protein [Corynebacterium epidermidicanis]AKK03337.1 hypothetical protein CEPID_07430 [Corynebacterium epidermidicanis]
MTRELASIGMNFTRWQDAVEAAIASEKLEVTGEVRGGQLIDFLDESGATLTILAAEPFTTFSGFTGSTRNDAHVSMINDVLALNDLVNDEGYHLASVVSTLAQGPLLVDEPTQQWQQLNLSALAINVSRATDATTPGTFYSAGAEVVNSGSAATPDATFEATLKLENVNVATNSTTGVNFIHATASSPFPLDICLPAEAGSFQEGDIITGQFLLAGRIIPPAGCGGDDGCGSGGCGCGSGGCGGH